MRTLFASILGLITACTSPDPQQLRQQVAGTEAQFAEMAANQGIRAAFLHFAHPQATIMRHGKLWHGYAGIAQYFDQPNPNTHEKLQWAPDFIDIAQSGEMAYTYGSYHYTAIGPQGDTIRSQGIFHTVWRRLPDGSWRFVWD